MPTAAHPELTNTMVQPALSLSVKGGIQQMGRQLQALTALFEALEENSMRFVANLNLKLMINP